MKICAKMDCGNYVLSHGYCKFHQYLRQDSAFFKAKERQQEKVAVKAKVDTIRGEHHVKNNPKYVKKHTGELALFQSIWATRKHESFLSGIPLGEFNVSLFAHVLSKKQYSNFRLFDKNIILLTEYEHHNLDQGTMDSRARYQQEVREMGYDCDWLRITDLADKLKKEYK